MGREALAHGTGIDGQLIRRMPKMAGPVRALISLRLVCQQQFKNRPAGRLGTRGPRTAHNHAGRRLADTACGEHSLTFHFHHTRAAIAIRAVTRRVFEAKVRDGLASALGYLPECFAGEGLNFNVVQCQDETRIGGSL